MKKVKPENIRKVTFCGAHTEFKSLWDAHYPYQCVNDIALCKVAIPFDFESNFTASVELDTVNMKGRKLAELNCTLYGWGVHTHVNGTSPSQYSDILKAANVSTKSREDCNELLMYNNILVKKNDLRLIFFFFERPWSYLTGSTFCGVTERGAGPCYG